MTLEILDFYRVLQVDPRAEPEVIHAAHRSLARKYHPDVAGGCPERMVAINQAWAVLGDPRARSAYDRDDRSFRRLPPRRRPGPLNQAGRQASGGPTGRRQAPCSTSGGMPVGRLARSRDRTPTFASGSPAPRSGAPSGPRSRRCSRQGHDLRPQAPAIVPRADLDIARRAGGQFEVSQMVRERGRPLTIRGEDERLEPMWVPRAGRYFSERRPGLQRPRGCSAVVEGCP